MISIRELLAQPLGFSTQYDSNYPEFTASHVAQRDLFGFGLAGVSAAPADEAILKTTSRPTGHFGRDVS